MTHRQHIEHLWDLLDAISTAVDQYKPDLSDPFVKRVIELVERREEHGVQSFDGQNLEVPEAP